MRESIIIINEVNEMKYWKYVVCQVDVISLDQLGHLAAPVQRVQVHKAAIPYITFL